ncbi:YybH family protein [Maricaulis maris]|uniref:SnoaL-like domain-containing protein n=1 Tax=Maricaulis maris TaxID=74318 RepID=A0A495DKL0_9PROT|nr:nuclear transport factor 2 family protein [Maricaulis maris]RKR03112.1 hypothetical protein C7435_1060 [Maricaulis maris]
MRHVILATLLISIATPAVEAQDLPGWADSLNANRPEDTSEFYASDAVIMPPGTAPSGGRDAIARYWSHLMTVGLSDVDILSRETLAAGPDRIYETALIFWRGADGARRLQRSVILWELRSGEWQILRHTWNYGPQRFD